VGIGVPMGCEPQYVVVWHGVSIIVDTIGTACANTVLHRQHAGEMRDARDSYIVQCRMVTIITIACSVLYRDSGNLLQWLAN